MEVKTRKLTVLVTRGLLLAAASTLSSGCMMGMHRMMMGESDQNMMGMHGMMMGEGDQKLTKADYLKHAEDRFARMDANKDGVIDATDRAAMHKRMQECMGTMGGGMGMMGSGLQDGGAGAAR